MIKNQRHTSPGLDKEINIRKKIESDYLLQNSKLQDKIEMIHNCDP